MHTYVVLTILLLSSQRGEGHSLSHSMYKILRRLRVRPYLVRQRVTYTVGWAYKIV